MVRITNAAHVLVLIVAAGCCNAACAGEPIGGGAKPETNRVAIKMVLIPAGEFMMGNGHTADDELRLLQPYYDVMRAGFFDREYPQHRVRITRPFYMGAYHVTVGQFRRFVEASGYKSEAEKSGTGAAGMDPATGLWSNGDRPDWSWRNVGFKQTDDHPVVCVSWNDAVAFCEWLSRKKGRTYRLPTEAEWEYACRARTTTRFYNGEDPERLADIGNVGDQDYSTVFPVPVWSTDITIAVHDGYVFTAPVGRFKPNAFGLYDMIGNARQWCRDWFDGAYYSRSAKDDPPGPKSGECRVLRGCPWCDGPENARCAHREQAGPAACDNETGFRVVRSLSDSEMRAYTAKRQEKSTIATTPEKRSKN